MPAMPSPENSDGPRIPPVMPEDETDRVRAYYASGGGDVMAGPKLNVVRTLANHPDLGIAYRQLGRHVGTKSTLPRREKEIAIVRAAFRYHCDYELFKHVRVARALGISEEVIDAIKDGPTNVALMPFDRTLVRAVDQLVEETDIDDETWVELAEQFDHEQMLDFLMCVGCYAMLAMVLNAVRVEHEPEYVE